MTPVLRVVAHRGYSAVAPENTLPAFAAAVRCGAEVIEFDVRTSADGVPYVIHDRSVDRTSDGHGQVGDLRSDEIAGCDAGAWFSPAFAGQRVPSLSQVLDLLAPGTAELLVEIKRPATVDQVKVIVSQLAEQSLLDRSVVQSFDSGIVAMAAQVAPELRRGLLRDGLDPDPVATAEELGVVSYNPSVDDVLGAPAAVQRLRAAGIGVMPWTANDPAIWPKLVQAGVSGIITDRVGELIGWRGSVSHGDGR